MTTSWYGTPTDTPFINYDKGGYLLVKPNSRTIVIERFPSEKKAIEYAKKHITSQGDRYVVLHISSIVSPEPLKIEVERL